MSWQTTLEERRAGLRPHFIGQGESREAFEARMAPVRAAQADEAAEWAEFRAFKAAQAAAAAPAVVPEAPTEAGEPRGGLGKVIDALGQFGHPHA